MYILGDIRIYLMSYLSISYYSRNRELSILQSFLSIDFIGHHPLTISISHPLPINRHLSLPWSRSSQSPNV